MSALTVLRSLTDDQRAQLRQHITNARSEADMNMTDAHLQQLDLHARVLEGERAPANGAGYALRQVVAHGACAIVHAIRELAPAQPGLSAEMHERIAEHGITAAAYREYLVAHGAPVSTMETTT